MVTQLTLMVNGYNKNTDEKESISSLFYRLNEMQSIERVYFIFKDKVEK